MQFEVVGQQQVNATNAQTWIDLCNKDEDFSFILNKDILRQMIYAFQTYTNEKCREYCMAQEQERIGVIDDAYSINFKQSVDYLNKLNEEKEEIKLVNAKMERSFEVTNTENENIRKKIELNNAEIAKKQNILRYEENVFNEQIQEKQEILISKQQEKEQINQKLVNTVKEYNKMVEQYDDMYKNYEQYKRLYDEARRKREILRNQQH